MAVLTGQIDYVILDPPRVGCMPEALDAVARMRPRKVVVVSCEPSALARDLAILVRGGFTLTRTQPVDMFPQTRHVETLATLEMR
jgi:23S rRNA (uracil1939-C5)-methyltransferase